MSTVRSLRVALIMAALALQPTLLTAQAPGRLVTGQLVQGAAGEDGTSSFTFEANSAGVLTVVARSMDGSDLVLLVTDADGQPVREGRSDLDLGGDSGAEQFAVTLPRAGSYLVVVESFSGGEATYQVGVSWLSFPNLELAPDPDGSPSSALRIQVGQDAHEDSIDAPTGDYWDWYVLTAEQAGTLTVTTRAAEGDLVLEAFEGGDFSEAMERSDQDLQGQSGNEALTLVVEAGQELFFKVAAFSEGASIRYRLQVGLIPD
jgi:hypothetical protein